MYPSSSNNDHPNYPPPGYSPPGQNPNNSMQSKENFKNVSAPPPPGLQVGQLPPNGQLSPNVQLPPNGQLPPNSQQSPIIIYSNGVQFGPYPMRYTCPNCNAHVMTETHSTPGCLTYLLSGALCIVACYLCCCIVPFCFRECKDIEHRCPNCHHKLGLFKRI